MLSKSTWWTYPALIRGANKTLCVVIERQPSHMIPLDAQAKIPRRGIGDSAPEDRKAIIRREPTQTKVS